jgi:hypothetical protein
MPYQRSALFVHFLALFPLLISITLWSAPIDPQPQTLKIVTLQGEGAVNDSKTKIVTEPVVEVRDSRELPVADAEVIFQFPTVGPSGVFPDHSHLLKTKTNSQGQAAATGLLPNDETGRFNIKVTATSNGRITSAIIAQSNSRDLVASERSAKRSKSRKWKVLVLVGGAAATGGIILATRGGDSAKPIPIPNSLTVSPGTITIGGPH